MTLKATMLFGFVSNITRESAITRTAGWTESYYVYGNDIDVIRPIFRRLCQKRAQLLPNGSSIIGQRFQTVDPVGPSSTFNEIYPGRTAQLSDIPQMALYCKLAATGTRNTRGLKLKGIPDFQVQTGEYTPEASFSAAVTVLMNELKTGVWLFRARDLSLTQYPLLDIAQTGTDGIVHSEVPVPYVVGDFVRILKTKNIHGRFVGGRFRVSAATGGNVFTLANYDLGNCTKGQVRKDAIIFPVIGQAVPVRISTAKVGRPFDLYRGRRSKR